MRTGVGLEGREETGAARVLLCIGAEDGKGGPDAYDRVETASCETRAVGVDVERVDGEVRAGRTRLVGVEDPGGFDEMHRVLGPLADGCEVEGEGEMDAFESRGTRRRGWRERDGGWGRGRD